MTRRGVHSFVWLWTAISLVLTSCRTPAPVVPVKPPPPPTIVSGTNNARSSVAFDAKAVDGKVSIVPRAGRAAAAASQATELSAAETTALVARMSPLPNVAADNASAPSVRPSTPQPPKSGNVKPIPFAFVTGKPVAGGPGAPGGKRPDPPRAIAPLQPPVITPGIAVRRASTIQVRFFEAMVPVATLASAVIPKIDIAPAVAGKWRWVDTRLLQFDPKDARLPNATEYTVTVPAGLAAVSGARLAEPAVATFSTTPVAIEAIYPRLVRPDSAIVVAFDQAIDPATLAASIAVGDLSGKQRYPYKVVTLADAQATWALNPSIGFDAKRTDELLGKHRIVIAPVGAWPAGKPARVRLAEGAASAEGPLKSTVVSTLDVDVVAPLALKGIECRDKPASMTNVQCPVDERFEVEITNRLDEQTYRPELFTIAGEPAPTKHRVPRLYNRSIAIYAPAVANRMYTVRVGDGLRDIYGQPLTGPRQIVFKTIPTPARDPNSIEGYLWANQTGMNVLDPRYQIPQWIVYASEVDTVEIQLFAVQPRDFFQLEALQENPRRAPFGRRMFKQSYAVGIEHGADIRVDLRPALGPDGTGHVLAVATGIETRGGRRRESRELAWLQVTKLGLSARIDREKIHTWAHDITPAKMFTPIAGVTTSLVAEGRFDTTRSAATNAEGFTALDLLPPRRPAAAGFRARRDDPKVLLVATSATDSAFMTIDLYEKAIRERSALWYATEDRFTYKPGEQVFVKGWQRWTHDGVNPELSQPKANTPLRWTLHDSRGNRLASGTTKLTDQGGFDLVATIPPNANLGTAMFSLSTEDSSSSLAISIEEFRTPAFSVTLNDDVTHAGNTPLFLGDAVEMMAEASYFGGGGLPGADVEWTARLAATSFTPPGWSDFSFDRPRKDDEKGTNGESTLTNKLDARSSTTVAIAIEALPYASTSRLDVDAVVVDVDRQRIRASSRSMLVHASSRYIGITKRRDESKGVGVFEMIATDTEGKPIAGIPIEVAIEGEAYDRDKKLPKVQHGCKVTSAAQPVRCTFPKLQRYSYEGTARIVDERGRPAAARYAGWVTDDSDDDLQIVPDKDVYTPGEIAKLEVRSKTLPATAIVTFARRGVVGRKRVELKAPSVTVDLPIELGYVQNIHVQVDRYRPLPPDDPDRKVKIPLPSYDETVAIDLAVDPDGARLDVKTRATKALIEPGEEATFEVVVAHGGKPKANAEVALFVVDEAILSVSGEHHEDPLESFLQNVDAGTEHRSSIDIIHDAGDDVAGSPGFDRHKLEGRTIGHGSGTGSGYGVGGGRGGMAGRVAAVPGGVAMVKAREDFRPNALFAPRLRTDANGRATATVKMPDSLTRFRIVALATADTKLFGKGENAIVTQRRINARTVAPRFLTQGDRFEVPVVVQNLDRTQHTIDVAVRAANLAAVGSTGKRVTVPPGQRAELRFSFATQEHGRAVIQTMVVAGSHADSSNVEIPIHRPATTESFASYGIVDGPPQFEQLAVPADILSDVGGIEVELASSQLQSLTDAYWYLHAYPYECFEQRSSRMLATSAMYDLLDAFAAPGRPTRKQIDAQRALDARILQRDQSKDGGWGYFKSMKSHPMVSLQVLSALGAQKITGEVTKRAVAFATQLVDGKLSELEKIAAGTGASTSMDDRRVAVSLVALGLSALRSTGFDTFSRADRLHAIATKLGTYPVDAQARVLSVVSRDARAAAIRTKLLAALLSATQQTASSATVAVDFVEAERLLLVSSTKTNALVLDALITEAPNNAVIPKLARGILDARKHGRWRTTQENMVVMQAMRRYFHTYEKQTPNYTAKVWIGDAAYTERKFFGRDRTQAQAKAPWTAMTPGTAHDLAFVKAGAGRLYYRIGITYAPKRTDLPALDAGFIVHRSYSSFNGDPTEVVQQPDGTWKIKLGAKVLVTVDATTTAARHAVALVDPLPAGFETINTRLATSERGVGSQSTHWDHQNLRDNRSETFRMAMPSGTHRFMYVARATTPGTFIASPAKAEEMYSPETFGRSNGTVVVVE